jgi:hypothetical protein
MIGLRPHKDLMSERGSGVVGFEVTVLVSSAAMPVVAVATTNPRSVRNGV